MPDSTAWRPAGMPAGVWPVFQKLLTLEIQPVSSLEAMVGRRLADATSYTRKCARGLVARRFEKDVASAARASIRERRIALERVPASSEAAGHDRRFPGEG